MTTTTGEAERRGPWATELVDVVRAASGGMLFGIPLLFTMEVWWLGSATTPKQMLAVLGITVLPVFFLNRTSGFRSTTTVRLTDAVIDTVEAIAIGIVCVTAMLLVLREITSTTPLATALGKILYEATPFSIGVGLAHHFLRQGRDEGDDDDDDSEGGSENGDRGTADAPARARKGSGGADSDPAINATLADIGATVIGSIFVAFSIAPTDEVPMLTAAMSPQWLIAVMAVSLLVSYCIVFVGGFSNEQQRTAQRGIFQRPVSETVACYLVSLISSGFMLWYFQQIERGDPWNETLSHIVVLGLPAAVGGAAGRLAV